jgi:hypothetical protein
VAGRSAVNAAATPRKLERRVFLHIKAQQLYKQRLSKATARATLSLYNDMLEPPLDSASCWLILDKVFGKRS